MNISPFFGVITLGFYHKLCACSAKRECGYLTFLQLSMPEVCLSVGMLEVFVIGCALIIDCNKNPSLFLLEHHLRCK